eukprot:gene5951-18216_t
MATKVSKITSNQSGPFNATTNNTVDITLPSYLGMIDPTTTCIVLDIALLNKTDNSAVGLFDASFNDGLDARCLLKNVSLSSDKNGIIEQIPAVNILTANMSQFTRDFEDENSDLYLGFQSEHQTNSDNSDTDDTAPTTNRLGTFIRRVNNGTRLSQAKTFLKIPLSSIFGICKMKQLPLSTIGNLKISLEFEDDTVNVVPHLFKTLQCADITGFANGVTVSSVKLPIKNGVPLFVGQNIVLNDGSSLTDVDRVVTSLTTNTDGTVTVSWTGAVTFAGGVANKISAKASAVENTDLTYQINDVEVEVYQYSLGPNQSNKVKSNMRRGLEMGFTTYALERINLPNISKDAQYTRQFDLEPNTINCYGMLIKHFDTQDQSQPLFAVNAGFGDYRWRLDGVDTTSRSVIPYQSLYNDRLLATMQNGYTKVKNLRVTAGIDPPNAIVSEAADAAVKTYLIPTPIPKKDENQTIQLRMLKKNDKKRDGTNPEEPGSIILHMWKQVEKSIKIRGGGIEVN